MCSFIQPKTSRSWASLARPAAVSIALSRGGIFDRFNLEQGDLLNIFRENDYTILMGARANGAPEMREGGLFVIKSDEFDSSLPFKLNLIMPYRVGGMKKFKSLTEEYKLPARFFE